MKKFLVLTIALVVLTTSSAFALISGSAHDFSAETWTDEICNPCHIPHNGAATPAPLWNHADSATDGAFTLYSNPATLDHVMVQPTGVSLACLSCHDGATNLDAFGGDAGTTLMGALATGNLGTSLANDHPVGFAIVDGTDTDIRTLATITLPLYGASSDMLECATCHDVHNTLALPDMLQATNVGSALCLDCHIK